MIRGSFSRERQHNFEIIFAIVVFICPAAVLARACMLVRSAKSRLSTVFYNVNHRSMSRYTDLSREELVARLEALEGKLGASQDRSNSSVAPSSAAEHSVPSEQAPLNIICASTAQGWTKGQNEAEAIRENPFPLSRQPDSTRCPVDRVPWLAVLWPGDPRWA